MQPDPDLNPINLPPVQPTDGPTSPAEGATPPTASAQQFDANGQPLQPEWQKPPLVNMNVKPSPVRKALLIILALMLVAAVGIGSGVYVAHYKPKHKPSGSTYAPVTTKKTTTTAPKTQGVVLDKNKNYGNKYASGILPVGDGRYNTDKPTKGFIYACSGYAQNVAASAGQAGAGSRGPWFTSNNTAYDVTKKAHVQGGVMWQASFTNTVAGATRTIVTNDLPTHPTGIFPIATNDPAYATDRNPNTIKGQNFTYQLTASPVYSQPTCMGGEVGVMLTGVTLFNGFDAGGRDAGAWEVQDACDGHPQKEGVYHYHTLSSCIKDTSVQTVVGYALDGFPITGPKVAANSILTTDDLDECHGLTSQITLDGKLVTSYHYVMTQDFPYSVSCFRGKPIDAPSQPGG